MINQNQSGKGKPQQQCIYSVEKDVEKDHRDLSFASWKRQNVCL